MHTPETYPVPREKEQMAISLGFFRPLAPPTDAQRMEAAQMVEGWQMFKRTAYWMYLEKIVKRDLPRTRRLRQERLQRQGWNTSPRQGRKPTRWGRNRHSIHYNTPRMIEPIEKDYATA